MEGPRPRRHAASTVPRRYTMMRLAGAKKGNIAHAAAVQPATIPAART